MGRRMAGLVSVALVATQAGPPRYRAAEIACVGFAEDVRNEIRTEAGGRARDERSERFGLVLLRAAPGDSGITIEAWYDTLAVSRTSPEGKSVPDTEGVLGGRWRGLLTPEGVYLSRAVPFVPDEVTEVTDLHGVFDDFFPRLGDRLRRDPEGWWRWRDSTGEIQTTAGDSLQVSVTRTTVEEGSLRWDRGPAEWRRTIRSSASAPPGSVLRQGIKSVVTQRITVTRLPQDRLPAGVCGPQRPL